MELLHLKHVKMITSIVVCELLAMSVWFSASVIAPELAQEMGLEPSQLPWLTIVVQLGFVVGALLFALFRIADRYSSRVLFSTTALAAALTTLLIPFVVTNAYLVFALRFLTGFLLVGVYPIGMKVMASWTSRHKGLGIGLVVGALTIGVSLSSIFRAFGGVDEWECVLYGASFCAIAAATISYFTFHDGPHKSTHGHFQLSRVAHVFTHRDIQLINLGYLGHMWELYAMWTWLPLFLLHSFSMVGVNSFWAYVVAFVSIGAGGVGSVAAGLVADRVGRGRVIIASLVISGLCALSIGFLFAAPAWIVSIVAIVWGFAVVADSAQFSASIVDRVSSEYVGTALTVQTCAGFLLTTITISLTPFMEQAVGWRYAFMFLALGPMIGTLATYLLDQRARSRTKY